ncbi:MAG: iron-sulfur cluster-binding protein [Deltaproteobacteria bacterium]|nr:iron-sulfur cluster-binding protein [Deltaproteobacteria bacterium]
MEFEEVRFEEDSEKALRNKSLQKALVNVTNRFRSARNKASEEVPDWEGLRTAAREIKKETIENLDKYLLMLEEKVKKAGGKVHWAKDAEEASQIIINIAREGRVKSVVKSKSMATEEIELNSSFEHAGIKVVETDLGEYIIQLAGEHPSHIIVPAIHKTKEDISILFSEKLGIPRYDKPEELTKVAREKLRGEFLNADMGVSGANFAVAETGTIAVVENEGNARLTTTVPKIHVALVGIEKLIPRYEDLSLFLTVLARSATGQKSSTYVSFITGPKRSTDIDGPEEFHLVLLDNGRSKILASEETRESLYCIRCGACLNICPVYRQVGGHSYGWVYSGPIGAIITPQLMGIDKAPELPFASSLCGACKDVCPVKIDFPKVLLELRKKVVESKMGDVRVGGAKLEKLGIRLWRFSVEHESIYKITNKLSYYFQLPWRGSNGKLNSLPYPFSRWTDQRDFPAVAKKTFREKWKEIKSETG